MIEKNNNTFYADGNVLEERGIVMLYREREELLILVYE